eukprot:TRINITY_DN73580_c0_g1_i1.p1 TRINITY_DN73580_c0_g1~~TRINITY_DN73580_c0_g1_i1.p1  ORF type:complete len:523 (-),score=97.23 TRINITY_DN73580_c0_g1_i1:33-1601(-)
MAAEAIPRFCILGGGVSGLASAFFLQRSLPHARVTVVEASQRLGGLMQSTRGPHGEVREQGFHSSILVNKNGREALGLLKLLKMEEDVVSANIEASARRHLFHFGRVQLIPGPQHILRYCPTLMLEPLWPRGRAEDESVHGFIARRSSRAVADRLADPICRGQLAGDARNLSARTCFPRLWYNERRFGSVFLGAALSTMLAYNRRSWLSLDLLDPLLQRIATGGRSYTLRQGLGSLAEALEAKLLHPSPGTRPAEILRGISVEKLQAVQAGPPRGASLSLSNGESLDADCVLAALPPAQLAELLQRSGMDIPDAGPEAGSLCTLLKSVVHKSVAVANVSFGEDVLKARGFRGAGYFVGSLENQGPVLSMSWDSQLFPELSAEAEKGKKTQLTVHLDASGSEGFNSDESAIAEAALLAVREHLGVKEDPLELTSTLWEKAVPQYEVGHHRLLAAVNTARLRHLPWLQVVGPGFHGIRSVADEIVDARELTDSLAHRFARFPGLVENETEEDALRRCGGGFAAA